MGGPDDESIDSLFCWHRQLIRHRTEYNLTCLVFTLCLVHLSLDNFVSSWQLHWKLPTGLSIWKPGNVLHLQYPLLCLSLADQHQGIFKQMGVNLAFSHFVNIEAEWKVWTVLRFCKLAQVGKSGGLIRPQNFLAHTHSFWQNLDNLYYEPCSLLPLETRHAVCGVKIDFFLSLGSLPSDVWRKETLSGRYWDQSRNSGTILFSQLQRRPHLTVRSS